MNTTLNSASRGEFLDYLLDRPADIGKIVGFSDFTELHNGWLKKMIEPPGDFTLQAHRGSYKTTCLALGIAFRMVFYPWENTIFMRKTGGDVVEVIRLVSRILHTDVFAYIFKRIYGCDLEIVGENSGSITLNNYCAARGASQLLGIGTVGSLTGKHADCVITDDIVNLQDRISQAERDRIKGVYQELQNIRNRGGVIINTGTPWHKEDAFSLMPNIECYDCYNTGLLSDAQIDLLKKSMSPSLFAANYELRHIASDDVIFPNPKTGADPVFVEQGTGHIDAAYHGEDFTAYTLCRLVDGKYYVFGKMWRKHIDDVLDQIIELHHSLNGGKIYCEENGDKGYLGRDLRKRGERVVIYSEHMNKYLKITSYLKFAWENVIFVQGTDKEYIEQIVDFNDNAEHDDAPDSLASLVRVMPNKKKGEGYLDLWSGVHGIALNK